MTRPRFQQTAAAGAIPIIALQPTAPLSTLDRDDAEALVRALEEIARPAGASFYLSFAPDMNGTWVGWGQQPADYRAAFTDLAAVVHERMPGVAMLWSPFWGGDYPFSAVSAATGVLAEADTDGDGVVGPADDPYAPYYPGDAAVDAVGLSLYHDSTGGADAVNTVPSPGAFVARLTGTEGGAPDFYDAYADPQHPLIVETAAFYSPSAAGAGELERAHHV